jgi:competence protein ComEA
LTVVAVVVFGLLLYRGYGSKFQTNPTQQTLATSPLNVNTADRTELLQVPGVGPSLADAILSHRNTFGPFNSLDELDGVKGIGGKTLDKLRPWLHAEAGPVARAEQPAVERLERKPEPPRPFTSPKKLDAGKTINVNKASLEELQQLPGIGPKLAERIVQERAKEPFLTAEDLRRVGGIGAKTVEKLRPHLRFTDPR